MTDQRNFKRLVRDRMARTGERYTTARAHVLAADPASTANQASGPSGRFRGVIAIGGQQPDLAAARNLCANAGVRGPDGGPLTEAMAFGLAGGLGFLYGVFSYDDGPTMTIVARHDSMPDPFCEPLFGRVGAEVDIATTGGAKKAAATLDAVLADERPALCTVGAGALPYLGESEAMAGMAPHVVGVVGLTDDGSVLVDDRAPTPIPVDRPTFDTARAAYTKAKHRLITVSAVDPDHDWAAAMVDAVETAPARFDEPPVPQFAANVGLAGLTKWQRLLTATGDAKGWPKVFAAGRDAAIGLSRLHDCIDHAYTAPAAGRPLYADFLAEAGAVVGGEPARRWREAAERFRVSGESWRA
ncbi:MAG: BtrH N-terminal domain-containing protein, partial [Actinomycetota bacterium]